MARNLSHVLSIIVTSNQDEKACYLTVFSVLAQMERSGIRHEIIVVADHGTETKWENKGVRCLCGNFGSPQASRDAGIQAAKFDDVLCLEAHVIVSDIVRLLTVHRGKGGALTFCTRRGESPELFDVYGCETAWEGDLWYKRLLYCPPSDWSKPYRIAQFGHSCFMVDKRWYQGSGGYTNLLSGWGGEEPLLCLKAWMLGRECWFVPFVWHAHYLTPGAHSSEIVGGAENFKRNFEIVTYVLDGRASPNMKFTEEMKAERKRIVSGPFMGSLDKLREYLKREGVVGA